MTTSSHLNPLALSALALLAEAPMHPYEMFQLAVQRRDQRLVKIKPGTLYHAVSRLEKDGLIRVRGVDRGGNRPERTTYEITDLGRSALSSDIAVLLAEPAQEYPVFPFALGEAHNLPSEQVSNLLRQRLSNLRGTVAELDDGISDVSGRDLPWAYWLHLDYLRTTLAAEISWIEGALADIAAGRFDVPAAFLARTPANESNR
jgi:DNA-binding PadR family transcriptional regulator